MSYGQGNITWVNIPGGSGGGGVTGANEGLHLEADKVQLGQTVRDTTEAVTENRNVLFDESTGGKLTFSNLSGPGGGTLFEYDPITGVRLRGFHFSPPGERTDYTFDWDGLKIIGSGSYTSRVTFKTGFFPGVDLGFIGGEIGNEFFISTELPSLKFQIKYGTNYIQSFLQNDGLYIGNDNGYSAVTFNDNLNQYPVTIGITDWAAGQNFSIVTPIAIIQTPLVIDTVSGNIGLGGMPGISAVVQFSDNFSGLAVMNVPAQTTPAAPADGDIWSDGNNLFMQIGGVTKTFTLI